MSFYELYKTTIINIGPSVLFWMINIFVILLTAFYIWMFVDLIRNKKISKQNKGMWIVLFIFFTFVSSIIWFFVRKGGRKKK